MARLSLQQAESQINKQTKGEGLRKPERPSLHLRIPVPPGTQPIYISSPPAAGEGFLKPGAGGGGPESPSELFLKLPTCLRTTPTVLRPPTRWNPAFLPPWDRAPLQALPSSPSPANPWLVPAPSLAPSPLTSTPLLLAPLGTNLGPLTPS